MLELLELELRDGKHCRVVINRDGTILEYAFEKYDVPDQMYWDLFDYELKPPETGPRGSIYIPAIDHIERFIMKLRCGETLELPIDLEALGLPGPLLTLD